MTPSDLGLGPDAQKIEDPEDAREQHRGDAKRRGRRGAEAREKSRVHDPGQRLGDQRQHDGECQREEGPVRPADEGMLVRRVGGSVRRAGAQKPSAL